MDFEERRNIVYKILEIGKRNLFNTTQKKIIYNVITNLQDSTNIQIERLALYYNFKDEEKQYSLSEIGKLYNCSTSAIRFSVARARINLIHTKDEDMIVLKNVLEEFLKENNIDFI